jgi:hypothetical protein
VAGIGHGQLELDAVGVLQEAEQLAELFVREPGSRGADGAKLPVRWVKQHHPEGVTTHHPGTTDSRAVAASGYEIRVKGRLSDTVTEVFEDFTASVRPAETTLRGQIRDQAELHGLLEQIQSLGLELIEVKRLD